MTDDADETSKDPTMSEHAARLQRQQVLSELAQSIQPNVEAIPTVLHSSQSPHRRWRIALAIVLAAAILGAVGYYVLPRPAHPAGPTGHPHVIDLIQDGLACPQDVVWSPDGTTIAVLGYHQNCPITAPQDYQYWPGQLNTYAAATGALVAQIQPDDTIAQALHLAPPVDVTPATRSADASHQVIHYEHVLWSPDSKQLAIAFLVDSRITTVTNGVMLIDAAGTHAHILSHTSGVGTRYSGEWDLTTGAYIPVPAGTDPASWQPVLPALSYIWGADGTLAAHGQPLSLTSVPPTPALGPIGNPDGDHSFTVWQPAAITPVADLGASDSTLGAGPSLFQYVADFAAWSPDGSRLILDDSVFGLLTTNSGQIPSAGQLTGQRISATALLPMRDKGLAQGLADVLHSRPGSDTDSISVLWRPDGQVVAVPFQPSVAPGDPASDTASALPGVHLYACATGRLLGTLREPVQPQGQTGPIFVRWSPDGAHLLLLDSAYNALTSWGAGQLPRG